MSDKSPSHALSKLQWDKSFWERPEGKLGTLAFYVAAAGVIGATAFFLFPIITVILWNVVNLAIAAGVVAFIGVTARPVSRLFWLWNQRFWRKLHEWSITVDPVSAMYEYLNYFVRRMEVVGTSISAVRGVRNAIYRKFEDEKERASGLIERGRTLEQAGRKDEAVSIHRQAERLTKRLGSMQERLQRCDRFITFLEKYQRALKLKHEDVKDQIEDKESQYELAMQTANAVEAMRQVFGSGGEEQQDFDLALRTIDNTWANTVAEMEMLEDDARDVMLGLEIDDLSARQNGVAKLAELERRLDSGVFTTRQRVDPSLMAAISPPPGSDDALAQAELEAAAGTIKGDRISSPGGFFDSLYTGGGGRKQ